MTAPRPPRTGKSEFARIAIETALNAGKTVLHVGPDGTEVFGAATARDVTPAPRPARLRLSRAKGARLPEGAVVVARPSRWGNPWTLKARQHLDIAIKWAAHPERAAARWDAASIKHDPVLSKAGARFRAEIDRLAAEAAVAQFRALAEHFRRVDPAGFEAWIAPLRGRNLACWCAEGAPCHADVLLELANR